MNPKIKYMTYDFYAGEWYGNCGACFTDLFAPQNQNICYNFQNTHIQINVLGDIDAHL